ncbi:response regulator [Thermanaerosceptrum fracticalcis]|uniref:Stage 0 sporulation protein A homolog n=1 Tax=Thermanaerosceptrum fracticalcis TaxID=1712410 RepID=A0A7G6E2J2_THEFR|nr:response regulator transcription factor [Thermanaerosceptrum fracticalcis]QNB46296.1 response regulator [Thermanaerosceptrum fracticalcis]
MAKILIVDDDENIQELLKYNLEKEGHYIRIAGDGRQALEMAREFYPDLVLLDMMLPYMDGLEVCRQMQGDKALKDIPILILSAKGEELDKVVALELGAEDYLTKPFSLRELQARIKVRLRNKKNEAVETEPKVIKVGELELRVGEYEVLKKGQRLELSPKEFELLQVLMSHKGKVLKREFLLKEVWGYDFLDQTRTVDVHVRFLRCKLEDNPDDPVYIETVRGVGYRFRSS